MPDPTPRSFCAPRLCLGACLFAIAFLASATVPARAATAPPAPAVSVTTVAEHNVAPSHRFIGRVTAIQSVQIVPRVTAYIESVPVKQGSDVEPGQILFQLQKTQYQAAVQAAQAQLASAQAALNKDQVAYLRAKRLNKQGFEAQSNLDAAIATRDQDVASVHSAEANLAQAALNLSYCTIRSPIAGRIGAVTLTKGNLVTPTTPALATINQLNPIRVVFSVAERVIVEVEQKTGDTQNQIAQALQVNLRLPDGTPYPQVGKVAFLGNQVDPKTGTVPVYADFPNPKDLLLPGTYVSVEVRRATPEERVLVPVAAVQTDQKGEYVLTVGADNKVAEQPIVTGPQLAQNFVVTKGLKPGQRVIVAGLQKVHPGETVKPTVAAAPPQPAQAAAAPDGGAQGG